MLAVMMVALWLLDKEPNRDYYLPEGYEGWVTIRYRVPGADPLPVKDGRLQFAISDSGYLETSDELVVGWRRDHYHWRGDDGTTWEFPASVQLENGDYGLQIHQHAYFARDWTHLLGQLSADTDTVLPDKTRITIEGEGEVTYTTGKKTLEYFYVTAEPQSIMFTPPPNPDMEGLESTEDRLIDTR